MAGVVQAAGEGGAILGLLKGKPISVGTRLRVTIADRVGEVGDEVCVAGLCPTTILVYKPPGTVRFRVEPETVEVIDVPAPATPPEPPKPTPFVNTYTHGFSTLGTQGHETFHGVTAGQPFSLGGKPYVTPIPYGTFCGPEDPVRVTCDLIEKTVHVAGKAPETAQEAPASKEAVPPKNTKLEPPGAILGATAMMAGGELTGAVLIGLRWRDCSGVGVESAVTIYGPYKFGNRPGSLVVTPPRAPDNVTGMNVYIGREMNLGKLHHIAQLAGSNPRQAVCIRQFPDEPAAPKARTAQTTMLNEGDADYPDWAPGDTLVHINNEGVIPLGIVVIIDKIRPPVSSLAPHTILELVGHGRSHDAGYFRRLAKGPRPPKVTAPTVTITDTTAPPGAAVPRPDSNYPDWQPGDTVVTNPGAGGTESGLRETLTIKTVDHVVKSSTELETTITLVEQWNGSRYPAHLFLRTAKGPGHKAPASERFDTDRNDWKVGDEVERYARYKGDLSSMPIGKRAIITNISPTSPDHAFISLRGHDGCWEAKRFRRVTKV